LKPHPRNYRIHPPDQLQHIMQSIREHGIYRNIVVARDSTILAGHGVVQACGEMQMETVPVIRLPIEPNSPMALKVLTGDNEMGHLAEVNDQLFTELLTEIKAFDTLLGTGFDDAMLNSLRFITQGKTTDHNVEEEWAAAGLPGDLNGASPFKLVISFLNEADRERFVELYRITLIKRETVVWSARWPHREAEDLASLRFEPAATA
jgi:hypothetical protein